MTIKEIRKELEEMYDTVDENYRRLILFLGDNPSKEDFIKLGYHQGVRDFIAFILPMIR